MDLSSADICRDGGSIAADFRLEDGTLFSLLLEVSHSDNRVPPYRHLHCGDKYQNTCDPTTRITKGSAADAVIQERLSAWLGSVASDVRAQHKTGQLRKVDESLHWAIELCEQVQNREI